MQFAQKFVDACHHGVEEYILFQGANRSGFPFTGGPIYVMVSEHGVGRYLAPCLVGLQPRHRTRHIHSVWGGAPRLHLHPGGEGEVRTPRSEAAR
ncbi:hypothetical protein ODS41_06555 [Pyrobaculum sp. 3827-6]|uniref:hypothetical protein n=1 Tax=Pyrobaculum sp. 3827-6 TaxID=2983604 RepID=UPI0021DAC7C0|nr:hypothetical protein [Pyrobaculum sp. 3827-6]MCU7787577.1 hypothetical protein [Pyrobaculum sp. 3827-6]